MITESAYHSIFSRNMFIDAPEGGQVDRDPQFTVINVPSFVCSPEMDATRSEVCILLSFERRMVLIGGSEGRYEMRADSGIAVPFTAPVSPLACAAIARDAIQLSNGGSVPGADIGAVAAVLAYRQAHSWPYGPAHLDDPRTSLAFRNRNGRAFVSIVDYQVLTDRGALSCGGQEYYRVDLQALDVQPYDGCREGAPPQRLLPKLKELPG